MASRREQDRDRVRVLLLFGVRVRTVFGARLIVEAFVW